MTKDEKEVIKEAEKIKKKYKNRKRGLTDKITIAVALFTVAAFVFSATLMWVTKDTSGLAYFIPGAAGFGSVVLYKAIDKNTKEKAIQFGNAALNEDRYKEVTGNEN